MEATHVEIATIRDVQGSGTHIHHTVPDAQVADVVFDFLPPIHITLGGVGGGVGGCGWASLPNQIHEMRFWSYTSSIHTDSQLNLACYVPARLTILPTSSPLGPRVRGRPGQERAPPIAASAGSGRACQQPGGSAGRPAQYRELTASGRALHDRVLTVALERERRLLSSLSAEVDVLIKLRGRLHAKVNNVHDYDPRDY